MNLRLIRALILLASVQSGFSSQENRVECDSTCNVDPCRERECPGNTGAKCVSRCCRAYFYDKYGNDITSMCDCPSGVKPHPCKRDPCDTAACDKTGECRTNRCGGCDPVFYNHNAKEIPGCPIIDPNGAVCPPLPKRTLGKCNKSCRNGCQSPKLCCSSNTCGHVCKRPYYLDCPKGRALACKTPVCGVRKCARQLQATCRATCFGCIAHFFDQFDNEVTDKCKCSRSEVSVECVNDPCKTATCPNRPDAVCRTNTCKKCKAIFYDKRGKEIQCKRPQYSHQCPAVQRRRIGKCYHRCSFNRDCPNKQICCPNSCGGECQFPPQDERCPPPDPKIIEMLPRMRCMITECVVNGDCKKKDICCSDGCTRRCISAPFLDPRCDSVMDDFGPCINRCNSNIDCGRKEMCCRVGCGTVCIDEAREPKYDKRCPLPPAPVSEQSCPKLCSKNSDCRSDYMCCPLNCGTHCTNKPKSCDFGEFPGKCPNVCKGRICSNHPGAKCRVHDCNGCKAEFHDSNNRFLDGCLEE